MKELKTNKEILQEGFFSRKPTVTKRMEKKLQNLASYKPKDKFDRASGNPGYQGLFDKDGRGFLPVSDMGEISKRLVKTFGSAVGSNTIRARAGKSIKTFPILVSDNVDSDTAMALKKVLEEQYAEYLTFLISNQVIDTTEYVTAKAGDPTVAIQAIDKYHKASDVSSLSQRRKMGDAAKKSGKLTSDDYAMYYSAYNLFRESDNYKDNLELSSILEDAIIVDSNVADYLIEDINLDIENLIKEYKNKNRDSKTNFWQKNKKSSNNKISSHDELLKYYERGNMDKIDYEHFDIEINDIENTKYFEKITMIENTNVELDKYMVELENYEQIKTDLLNKRVKIIKLSTKYKFYDEYINLKKEVKGNLKKDVMLKKIDEMIDTCISNIKKVESKLLTFKRDANSIYEKARRTEYKKLKENIPQTSDEVNKAVTLLVSGRISGEDYCKYMIDVLGEGISMDRQKEIMTQYPKSKLMKNVKEIDKGIKLKAYLNALKTFKGRYLHATIMSNKSVDSKSLEKSFDRFEHKMKSIIPKRRKTKKYIKAYQSFLKSGSVSNNAKAMAIMIDNYGKLDLKDKSKKDEKDHISDIITNFSTTFKSILASKKGDVYLRKINENVEYSYITEEIDRLQNELDNSLMDLNEVSAVDRIISGRKTLDVPHYTTRSQMAYGSAEINKRDSKDRRFYQPLMIKVQFKERLSDGTLSDNELTAVIGVLGKIIRVPSEEMKYILESNYENDTVKQLTTSLASGKLVQNSLASIFSNKSIKKDIEKLPQTHEIWSNLKKLSTLAAASSMGGRDGEVMANAHLIFSMKEIDEFKTDSGVDYLRDKKSCLDLTKRYAAFSLMVANDLQEKVYIFDEVEGTGWNDVSYSVMKDNKSDNSGSLAELVRTLKR